MTTPRENDEFKAIKYTMTSCPNTEWSAFTSCEKAQRRLALYCLPVLSRSLVITDTRPFTVALATIFKRMGQNNSKVKQMRSLLENSQTVGQACGTSGSHHQAAFGVGRTLFFSTYTDSSNNHYFSSPVLATDL